MKRFYLPALMMWCSYVLSVHLTSVSDLPDKYADVMLEIDEVTIFDSNASIPYAYKYESVYYTYDSYKQKRSSSNKTKIKTKKQKSFEESDNGFSLFKKLFAKNI